jgi:hypothetical protein
MMQGIMWLGGDFSCGGTTPKVGSASVFSGGPPPDAELPMSQMRIRLRRPCVSELLPNPGWA